MKNLNYLKLTSNLFIVIFPVMVGCSIFRGKAYDDPRVSAQAEIVNLRESELKEAKQREKAAKQRLRAAKTELKALKSQVKRGY